MRKGAEVVVVGAGVFGLSVAWALRQLGFGVRVLERAEAGAGASGGPVGALAPFAPLPWSVRKAAQRDALLAAEAFWGEVGAEAGLDPGWGRIGRLMPLLGARERVLAEARGAAARRHWPGANWSVVSSAEPWLAAGLPAAHETLTMRVDPARAVATLAAAVGGTERAEVVAVGAGGVDTLAGWVPADCVVVAAGAATGALLAPFGGPAIAGEKGQALRLAVALPEGAPVVSAPGLWVVPHADGTVGVGSTSETDWSDTAPDAACDALLVRARALCPWLEAAVVVERWAALRPRAVRPDPVLGAVAPGIFVASGGYKTGFAWAPVVGELVARLVQGEDVALPAGLTGI